MSVSPTSAGTCRHCRRTGGTIAALAAMRIRLLLPVIGLLFFATTAAAQTAPVSPSPMPAPSPAINTPSGPYLAPQVGVGFGSDLNNHPLSVGVGLESMLTDRAGVRADLRYVTGSDFIPSYWRVIVGAPIHF